MSLPERALRAEYGRRKSTHDSANCEGDSITYIKEMDGRNAVGMLLNNKRKTEKCFNRELNWNWMWNKNCLKETI